MHITFNDVDVSPIAQVERQFIDTDDQDPRLESTVSDLQDLRSERPSFKSQQPAERIAALNIMVGDGGVKDNEGGWLKRLRSHSNEGQVPVLVSE